MPGKKSKVYRAYQYFKTGQVPSNDLSDSDDNVYTLLSQLDMQERIKWETQMHEVLDGGYVSRFDINNSDDFTYLIDNILKSDILLFKIDTTNAEKLTA